MDGVRSFPCFLYHEDKLANRWNLDCEILYGYRSLSATVCAREVFCVKVTVVPVHKQLEHMERGGSSGIAPFIIKVTKWT